MKTNEIDIQRGGKDKIDIYKWICEDSPGNFYYISKKDLEIDYSYQRKYSTIRTLGFASKWSWAACGVLIVSKRENGKYFVIDGQHRLMAALRRSDIELLPCMVFESKGSESIIDEAKRFRITNTSRHTPKSIELFNASLIEQDEISIKMQSVFEKFGIKLMSDGSRGLNSVKAAKNIATKDMDGFETVIELLSYVCKDVAINESLLKATYYLHRNLSTKLTDTKLRQRILSISPKQFDSDIKEASAYFRKGGEKIWAIGMLNTINKNLHNKYKFKEE